MKNKGLTQISRSPFGQVHGATPMTFRRDRAVKGLRENGCKFPEFCADHPRSCDCGGSCGLLAHSEYSAEESIQRLGRGLPIGDRRGHVSKDRKV